MTPETRTLSVGTLTRVEGEGALHIATKDGELESVQLNIYEPPGFFEAFLRGRAHTEAPDLTARVCGICPVAYQVSACNAVEEARGVHVDDELAALRRLLYCGEWINSHALHIYLLHAPDFLGYPDIVNMARDHAAAVERGLALKKAGNRLMEFVGGRAIHPVNLRLGGFYSVPTRSEFRPIAELLRRALDDALTTVGWVSGFAFPDHEVEHEFLALTEPGRYPIDNGAIARSAGRPPFLLAEFTSHVAESQVPYSTALHATLDGGRYPTGPLARFSLNSAALSPVAAQAARRAGLSTECRNPFRSIVVRAVEVVYAIEEAWRIIDDYRRPPRPFVDVPAHGTGHGVSEAPRGLLYHRYRMEDDGRIAAATIVPPTSQNQAAIEADLARVVSDYISLDDATLTTLCESLIRSYDPCISCSTHFLTLTVKRR
jgi:sulfhydrogenase subunit alpha